MLEETPIKLERINSYFNVISSKISGSPPKKDNFMSLRTLK